jgi:predicted alpha/beta superfamily hydrolase
MKKHRLSNVFTFYVKIKQLHNRKRKIWVYLPPDYNSTDKRYPVLYMHDGQNLFDEATSFAGQVWGIDKTLNSLFAKKKTRGVIVIGIDNGEKHRMDEYSPWKNRFPGLETEKGGKGDRYSDFIVQDLKPQIDKLFRTLDDRDNTGIGGSSLGGFISIYIGLKHPEIFSKIAAFSPSFFFAREEIHHFINKIKLKQKMRVYMDVGTEEGHFREHYVECTDAVNRIFSKNKKIVKKYVIDEGGTHNEAEWARRFPQAFLWLFS